MQSNVLPRVYRCSYFNEIRFLSPEDQALIVSEDMDVIPDGYGIYLYPESIKDLFTNNSGSYLLPDNCEDGSFVMPTDDYTIKVLQTADRPDRTLFTTGLCNSNCIMCPYSERYRLSADMAPIDLLTRYIDLMDPMADYVCITGGEPTLLRDDFITLVRHVKHHFESPILHILTNGRSFSYSSFLKAYLGARPYTTLLGIPLHADTASHHDHISQTPGSFDQTIRGLDNLYAAGEKIEIRIVTSKLNYKNLPALANMIRKRYPYCQHICLMGLEMMGNAMINRNDVWVNYDTIWPYVREATEILIDNGVEVQLYNYPLCIIGSKLEPLYRKSITPYKIEYLSDCVQCRRKDECGGFFRTTKVMPDITVYPFL